MKDTENGMTHFYGDGCNPPHVQPLAVDSAGAIVPKVGSSFYVTDANGARHELVMVGWHCAHGMSTRDSHYEHCKTKQGVGGILWPLYRLKEVD